jgi:trigger factor
MKIQVERNDACEALMTVEIDPPVLETVMRKAARRLSEKSNFPGFRKGKVPYAVVLNAVGEGALLDEALDILTPDVYRQALDEQQLKPSAVGTMKRIVSRQPLVLEFVVPLQPEISLGDYRSIRHDFAEPAVPEEDVERAMEQLRQSHSVLNPVQRPAKKGDVLLAEVQAHVVHADGRTEPVIFEGEENPVSLDLDDNLGGRFPGAGPSMEGIAEQETRTTEIQYPDTFPIARLRGLRVRLSLRCLGVKDRQIPDWTDELAAAVSEFPTAAELRQSVRLRLEKHAREEREEEYADAVIGKMMEGATVKYPPALLEEEVDEEVQSFAHRLERKGISLEVYLRTISDGMTGLRKEMEPAVRRKLSRRLFLGEMVRQEGLEPAEADVEQQLQVYRSVLQEGEVPISGKPDSMEATLRNLSMNDVLARLIVQRVVQIGQGLSPAVDPQAAESKS